MSERPPLLLRGLSALTNLSLFAALLVSRGLHRRDPETGRRRP